MALKIICISINKYNTNILKNEEKYEKLPKHLVNFVARETLVKRERKAGN